MPRRDRCLPRRDFLKAGAVAVPLVIAANRTFAAATDGPVAGYLEGLRQPDGGYAWGEAPRAHLTPTFGAIGCYHLLGQKPPDVGSAARFVRENHPFRIKRLERDLKSFEYQQIQALLWLEEEAGQLRETIQSWKTPVDYARAYERHGYPVFEYEAITIIGRKLLGLPLNDLAEEMIAYLDSRRRPNGSFNNTPAEDGSDGHVLNTWWGIQALDALDRAEENRDATIDWVKQCQRGSGGFTWQPQPFMAGNEDVAYTWAAVRILERLGDQPGHADACIEYLTSLRNADGGFAPRPGWDSNPVASYYALDALRALGALDRASASESTTSTQRPAARNRLSNELNVYTIQIEAHGKGSPAEAIDLAKSLRIHLWGAKNAAGGWIEAAQSLADREEVPVTFFTSNEEYGTWVDVPGMGVYSHTSDIIAPAGAAIGKSLAGRESVSWDEFRSRRLAPLEKAGGRLVWQFGENEALTRLFLDDSLARGGFAAISTFHFGNPDFANSEPFLKQYRDQIPYVGLQDAHGEEPWWFGDQLTGFRTLFLATEPTWTGWLDALANNRVVAVRHDAVSGGKTWMHGPAEVVEFVQGRQREWCWWNNDKIVRPLVSIVALTSESRFEAARPDSGVTIRVRCQWENTTQGRPKSPRVELVRLTIDAHEVQTTLVTQGPKNRPQDHYHVFHNPKPAPGLHTATAKVVELDTGVTSQRTIRFST